MSHMSPLRQKLNEAASELRIANHNNSRASRVKKLVEQSLADWGAVNVEGNGGVLGLESYTKSVPLRNDAFNAVTDGDPTAMMRDLQELKMAPRHIMQVTEDCLNLFDGNNTLVNIMSDVESVPNAHTPLAHVVGRTSASQIASQEGNFGLEAFGDDINRLASDDRLTMNLIIMRPWDNIMDKALARVTQSSPIVTVKVPSPEAYDWGKTQDANSTAQSRFGGNTYRLRDLYRNPSPVNSAPQKVIPLAANDSKSVLFQTGATHFKTGVDVSLLDLSRNAAVFTHAHVDRTDLIADGGFLDSVVISVLDGSTTEYFGLETRAFDLAMFTMSPSHKSSGQRQVIMECVLPITSATKQYKGGNSTIAAALTDAKIVASIRINATLNIQTGILQASGSVNLELKPLTPGATISGSTTTKFNGLVTAVAAYSVDLRFNEENQRKANLAVWVNYYETQFPVPRSRIYFTEYSMSQEIDENAIAATSSIVALGNGRRGLDVIVNGLNDISGALEFAAANPDIASVNTLDEQSMAGALVKPTVVTTTIDFDDEQVNTMNESTRLVEIHGRFRARFLSMCTLLMAKSLMLNQYKGGEQPVIKAWVHSSIADLVIGITDYHPELKDATTTASGADYSMLLPNGYRLDVIKSNLDCLQQRIYAVPVIESDMGGVLSAASIRDCGTITTNYTATNSGATVRRVATSTREIVMMSNRVGLCLEVKGIQAQLGDLGYTKIALNADRSESLAV